MRRVGRTPAPVSYSSELEQGDEFRSDLEEHMAQPTGEAGASILRNFLAQKMESNKKVSGQRATDNHLVRPPCTLIPGAKPGTYNDEDQRQMLQLWRDRTFQA